ncbi:MAG: hypothetical protein U0R80_05510 [Nocardioidaceae bacterium]
MLSRSLATVVLGATAVAMLSIAPSQASTPTPTTSKAALAACPTAPVPPATTSTKFGMSVKAAPTIQDGLDNLQSQFGDFTVARVFDPGIPPTNAWERRGPVFAGMTVATSFRPPVADVLAGKYDAALTQFFSTTPSNIQVYWTYYHEPEPAIAAGTFTAAQYRAAWQRIAKLAAATCKPNLYPTMILTSWTANPSSKRNWRDYYAGDAYVSVVAWDPYNQAVGTPTSYKTPDKVYDNVINASIASGKPWAVAETGTARTLADTSGTGRAAWLTSAGNYLASHHASWVSYFQSTVNGDFELRDTPGINAWSGLISKY